MILESTLANEVARDEGEEAGTVLFYHLVGSVAQK
jgi:hypothetical protein